MGPVLPLTVLPLIVLPLTVVSVLPLSSRYQVAVKVLKKEKRGDTRAVRGLKREIMVLSICKHR